MKYYLIAIIFLTSIFNTNAQSIRKQTTNINAWFMYFGDHKFADKWGVHLEAQFRRYEVTDPQQLLLRTGINYHFNNNAFATAGYCFVETYPYGEFAVKTKYPEHRTWEQVQFKNQIGIVEAVNRIRLEQRWMNLPVLKGTEYEPGDAVYQNRFRLLNRFSVPFRGQTIADKTFYATVYDELLLAFGENVAYNIFDQNRIYAAIGYKIPKIGRLELGYMQQLVLKPDGIRLENNNTFQLGLSSTIDFKKHK